LVTPSQDWSKVMQKRLQPVRFLQQPVDQSLMIRAKPAGINWTGGTHTSSTTAERLQL